VNEFSAKKNFVDRLRNRSELPNPKELALSICQGKRDALAKAFTLLESTRFSDQEYMVQVLRELPKENKASIRLGITGVPGVGKSTFIESFSEVVLQEHGNKIAVLSIDPSSPITGGSILGDKTRMERLSLDDRAFIRPTPAGTHLGGVARATALGIQLCEAAGYNIIFIETVGVGQSEVDVHSMTDFFLLLMLAGAGDQLQGIKRGIMELTDALVITKADGENKTRADHAKAEYASALHLFPEREDGWVPEVFSVSSIENQGLNEVWKSIQQFDVWQSERGLKFKKRENQRLALFQKQAHDFLLNYFLHDEQVRSKFEQIKQEVQLGLKSPMEAVFEWMEEIKKKEI
jgi:LAO/AO transport system kinase